MYPAKTCNKTYMNATYVTCLNTLKQSCVDGSYLHNFTDRERQQDAVCKTLQPGCL